MAISIPAGYNGIVHKEVQMLTQSKTHIIQWQDLKVMSEADLVLKLAQENGWKDCKVFGSGDMITQPLESMGWKLIPANLYEYSIPAKGVDRIIKIINSGVRIQGVIIADDTRTTHKPPKAAKPASSLPSAKTVLTWIAKALVGLAFIAVIAFFAMATIVLAPMLILGAITGSGPSGYLDYDPQLIILVEDGKGGTAWVSVYTWFD